ncbi:MAG TPA: hypothetical protein VFO62_07490 [Candidatus Binatia bacterium]|nr:hypothetical protein [Candidatus Binatia bacterium]
MAEPTNAELKAANITAAVVVTLVVVTLGKFYLDFQRDARQRRERQWVMR